MFPISGNIFGAVRNVVGSGQQYFSQLNRTACGFSLQKAGGIGGDTGISGFILCVFDLCIGIETSLVKKLSTYRIPVNCGLCAT